LKDLAIKLRRWLQLDLFYGENLAIITKIDTVSRTGQIRIFLDGKYAFSLEAEAALGLKVGQELVVGAAQGLMDKNEGLRVLAACYRSLAQRPHSERELRQKLARKHFAEAAINKVISDLKARRLLDDAEFARFWCENREAFRPRSRRLTGMELRQKGVTTEVAAEATAGMDDAESAFRAGAKKAKLLARVDYETFLRRMGEFLRRRGYSYETVKATVDRLWRERTTDGREPPPEQGVIP
jgi:regulatory protein